MPNAIKFDCGQRSHLQLMPMVIYCLEQIHDWGVESMLQN